MQKRIGRILLFLRMKTIVLLTLFFGILFPAFAQTDREDILTGKGKFVLGTDKIVYRKDIKIMENDSLIFNGKILWLYVYSNPELRNDTVASGNCNSVTLVFNTDDKLIYASAGKMYRTFLPVKNVLCYSPIDSFIPDKQKTLLMLQTNHKQKAGLIKQKRTADSFLETYRIRNSKFYIDVESNTFAVSGFQIATLRTDLIAKEFITLFKKQKKAAKLAAFHKENN
jgi:hypothetical protein